MSKPPANGRRSKERQWTLSTANLEQDAIREITEATGITGRLALYSTREHKKTRVRHFAPDYDEYAESEHPDTVAASQGKSHSEA